MSKPSIHLNMTRYLLAKFYGHWFTHIKAIGAVNFANPPA